MSYEYKLNNILSEELNLLFEHLKQFDFKYLFFCYSLFDKYHHKQYIERTQIILTKIKNEIFDTNHTDNIVFLKISDSFDSTLNEWQKRFGDIYWQEVSRLEQQVMSNSKSRIKNILEDRVELAISVIEEMISFYSDLLNKQNRYQQETPEQRLAEKHWIDQQKETLLKIQTDISTILKYND